MAFIRGEQQPLALHHRHKNAFAPEHKENIKARKTVSILSVAVIIVLFSLIAWFVGRPLVREFVDSPETFRAYVKSHGVLGYLIMIGIMALQVVVALIPGEPFEVGAGFVFGWVQGTLLCLAATALASALVFLAVRKWGVKLVELFFSREKIMRFSFMQNAKKLDILIFLLFLIPGTPKDLLTYLVGLTPMKLSTFLLLTTVARIPSVVSSAVTGTLAHRGSYTAAIITYGVTLVITVVCILLYRRVSKKEKEKASGEEPPEDSHA